MDNKPIRVLHVFGRTDMGGAESRVMDLYRNIDRGKIQFDFVNHTLDKCHFDDEIESLGGHIYHVPRFRIYNILSYKRAWRKLFKAHPEIEVVHGHMTSTAGIYLPIAKACGVALTIAHSRSAGVIKGLKGQLTEYFRKNLSDKCDVSLACSKEAAISAFGKEVTLIPNAINTSRFAFNPDIRDNKRVELGMLPSEFVVGHVGRFHYAKNHEFLIRVFAEIKKLLPESKLVLVGNGELRGEAEKQVSELGLNASVIFAGNQAKVEDFYQAFDYFVFPSRYEGLPGTVVEAQTAGLKCLISDTITEEVLITDLAKALPVSLGVKAWAEKVVSEREYDRKSHASEVRDKGFDAESQINFYTKLYLTGSVS